MTVICQIVFGSFLNLISFERVRILFCLSFRNHIFLNVIVVLEKLLLLKNFQLFYFGLREIRWRVYLIIRIVLLRIINRGKHLSIIFLQINFILLWFLLKGADVYPLFLRFRKLTSYCTYSIWIFKRLFRQALGGLMSLILLEILL